MRLLNIADAVMKWLRPKRLVCILSIILAAAVGILLWKGVPWKRTDRIYRIGWYPDPPFQTAGADARPTGLAIELVREAARRRGIRHEWVRQPDGADAA